MNLADYVVRDAILTGVEARDKYHLMEIMVDRLVAAGALVDQPVDRDEALAALRAREEAQSTAIGSGLAIPHARLPGFNGMVIAMATLRPPLIFNGMGEVEIVWLILVAEDKPTLALQAYSKVLELMQDDAVRAYFNSVREPSLIADYIDSRRIPVGGSLVARDIMRPPTTHILPQTPLREVVRQMRVHHIEAVAVEDENRRVLGEITCDGLFRYGMPDFFNQLQSVGFISKFDPFEKYFEQEAKATARDVMDTDFAAVQPDATMLEVVFALAVQRRTKVYVVDEGRRIGTIDRPEVLDRILGF